MYIPTSHRHTIMIGYEMYSFYWPERPNLYFFHWYLKFSSASMYLPIISEAEKDDEN